MTGCKRCPYCNQVLPEYRLNVRFPNGVKARLFDLIQRGGEGGVPIEDLMDIANIKRTTLKAHVTQMNELLQDTGYKIVGSARYAKGNYQLVKR